MANGALQENGWNPWAKPEDQTPNGAVTVRRDPTQKTFKRVTKRPAKRVPNDRIRIGLVCELGLMADGLAGVLEKVGSNIDVAQWPADIAPRSFGAARLIVVDLEALTQSPADVVARIRAETRAPIVAIGKTLDEKIMREVVQAGAAAFITRAHGREQAIEVVRRALRAAPAEGDESVAGEDGKPARKRRRSRARSKNPFDLTGAELRVLSMLCEGHTNLGIANRLGIKEGTVKLHLHGAYRKLGVDNRITAVRVAERIDAIQEMRLAAKDGEETMRDWLLPHMTDELRKKGETLFRRGDVGQTMYYIQSGRVVLKEIGYVAKEGDLLGEISIFSAQQKRTSTAYCDTDVRLFRLTADRAKRLYIENPQFAYHVVRLIANRLAEDRQRRAFPQTNN